MTMQNPSPIPPPTPEPQGASVELVSNRWLASLSHDEIKGMMRQIASDISERVYCAGWMDGTEHSLWAACEKLDAVDWGMGEVSKAEAVLFRMLAEHIGQWFDPRPNAETEYPCGRYFMPLAEWRTLCANNGDVPTPRQS